MDDTEKDWIGTFILHLEYERRLSALTCKHYRRDLDALDERTDEVEATEGEDEVSHVEEGEPASG